MKILYVPFNNRGLGVETYDETDFMKDLVRHATESHIGPGDEGIVFVYVSEPDSGFTKTFSQNTWPTWLKGINMVVRRHFSIEEGDKLALELADDDASNVVAFTPYPTGMLTEEEIEKQHKKLCDKWAWGYVAPIEKVDVSNDA